MNLVLQLTGVMIDVSDERANANGTAVKRARKASLSNSALATSNLPIHRLVSEIQDWVYYPDPLPLYVVLGTLAGNMLKGSPVWLMLIGAPSSGKTMILDALKDVPKVHRASSIKGPAALISGSSRKDFIKGKSTGGLLHRIGERGVLVLKDFTSVLSLDKAVKLETIAGLRDVYDGEWVRDIGTDGGDKRGWYGRIGFLGASTDAIDREPSVSDLGQRWIYFRYPDSDGYGETLSALRHLDKERISKELAERVAGFMEWIGIGWDQERRDLNRDEANRIVSMAQLMVAVRSVTSRDWRSREIDAPPKPELPQRMAGALGQLYVGLEAIGLGESERWSVVGKVASDSAPQIKVNTVGVLSMEGPQERRRLGARLKCGDDTMKRVVEDLAVFGVVVRGKGEKKEEMVGLSDLAKRHLRTGWRLEPEE